MGDHQHRAGIFLEVVLEPLHAFGVEVVGGLVEKENGRLLDKEPSEGDPALFATREVRHRPVGRWTTQCLHRAFELAVECPPVDRVNLGLEIPHLLHQGVEIGVLLGVAHFRGYRIEPIHHVRDFACAVLDVLKDVLAGIELRLLGQIADRDVFPGPGLALEFLVDPRHDLHQGRLARAVRSDDSDLGALVELQVDVVEHRLLRTGEGLGHVLHDKSILGGHGVASVLYEANWRVGRQLGDRGAFF